MKYTKYILIPLLALALAMSICRPAHAAEEVASGTCGENITWVLDSDGVLTISGEGCLEGETDDAGQLIALWGSYQDDIRKIVMSDGIDKTMLSFSGYANLTEIKLSDKLTKIRNGMFYNCTSLKSITLPEKCESIGINAFVNCKALEEVHFSAAVQYIEFGADADDDPFVGCTSIKRFVVDPDNPYLSNDEYGVLFNKDKTSIQFAPRAGLETYVIPEGVKMIGSVAFRGSKDLKSLVFSDTVIHSFYNSFENCVNLEEVILGAGMEYLGFASFRGCSKLMQVVIPASMNHIHDFSFVGCPNDCHVLYMGTQEQWKDIALYDDSECLNNVHFGGTCEREESDCENTGALVVRCSACQETVNLELPTLDHEYQDGRCVLCDASDVGGDANGDGKADYSDALDILRCSIGLGDVTYRSMADVNNDGKLDYSDALTILRRSIGLE